MTPQQASDAAEKVCLLAPVIPVLVIDDAATGVYVTTFFFGALVLLPAKALNKIAPTLIADPAILPASSAASQSRGGESR